MVEISQFRPSKIIIIIRQTGHVFLLTFFNIDSNLKFVEKHLF